MNARIRTSDHHTLAVTVDEAARLLEVGSTTIRELVRTGDLQSFKIGRCRRIRRSAIEKYIEDRENGRRSRGTAR